MEQEIEVSSLEQKIEDLMEQEIEDSLLIKDLEGNLILNEMIWSNINVLSDLQPDVAKWLSLTVQFRTMLD